jgi:hypothetical protein
MLFDSSSFSSIKSVMLHIHIDRGAVTEIPGISFGNKIAGLLNRGGTTHSERGTGRRSELVGCLPAFGRVGQPSTGFELCRVPMHCSAIRGDFALGINAQKE